MKLSLLLLMVLALCCLQANSEVCPRLVYALQDLLLDYPRSFEFQLARFGAPRKAVNAALEVKKCTDQTPFRTRSIFFIVLNDLVRYCSE